MNWLGFSLTSALFETSKDTYGKRSSYKVSEFTSAFSLHFMALLFSILYFLIFSSFPSLKTEFWIGSSAFLFITPAWSILYTKALKHSDLSVTLPMMAFNPIFTALLNFFFKGGIVTNNGWVGIFLISIGIYFIHLKKDYLTKPWIPILRMFKDKGALEMLGVAALWSFGAHFSKMRVEGSSPAFSTMTGAIIGVVTTYFLATYKKQNTSLIDFKNHFKNLAPLGSFYYFATILSSVALKTGPTPYVFAIKRSSIIYSSLVGKFLFKETFNKFKYLGLILIASGIVFISFN